MSAQPSGLPPNFMLQQFIGGALATNLLTMAPGRERNEAEHRDMLAQTGFRLERIIPTASGSSILEAWPPN